MLRETRFRPIGLVGEAKAEIDVVAGVKGSATTMVAAVLY